MQPFIVQGDKTSHGGTVLVGSPFSDCDGKPIARVGDMVSCPERKGVFPIAEGDQSNIVDGAPVAYDGCKTACGARLVSSQIRTLTEPSSGAAPGASDDGASNGFGSNGFGAIGAGMAAAYQEEELDAAAGRFQGRFQLVDLESGEPISGQAVRVRSTGGQSLTGATDAGCFTQWVERDEAEALAFDYAEKNA
ncbi:PAAR domain-containing protein [Massilia glaciei]|uniref:PAAR domain-containing protein n=1 Tax=Massilia glaciei TaxID=1524097 RepID=A0A2U2HJP6_9BURK|nr:PAAR domain-containing protein [Massilia glaciei]PWF47751.1 PAAR domain-containing protein [Massilia glaciei]